ncbi:MAG: formylglycine-generating enzyme family protein [Candidatus Saganbacteria bacterium]|nr:formylglycine-generating enzyme family protein [Candidatus Saganbacteria bacterium]
MNIKYKLISFEFEDILNTGQMLALSLDRLLSRESVTPAQLRLAGLPVATPLIGKYLESGRAESMLQTIVEKVSTIILLTVEEVLNLIAVKERPAIGSMVIIPGGKSYVGDFADDPAYPRETPPHPAMISPFLISPYPVTVREYAMFIADDGYSRDEFWSEEGIENRERIGLRRPQCFQEIFWDELASYPSQNLKPLGGVSWYEAEAYLNWAGQRFPTEHEWEYAARGGLHGKRYPWGDHLYRGMACFGKELSVGPDAVCLNYTGFNGYGLNHMAGGVWEWVSDWCGNTYYEELDFAIRNKSVVLNPRGPEEGELKVARGGCWASYKSDIQVHRRNSIEPFKQDMAFGFRAAGDLLDA